MKTFSELEIEGWNRNAAVYDQFDLPLTGQAFPAILESLGDLNGKYVLDLASGTGHLTAAAAKRGARLVGLDAAANMVEIARKVAPTGIDFHLGEAEQLPFKDAVFDAVMSGFGFLHFSDPDVALKEASRTLKPGGTISFTVWQAPDKGNEFLALILGTMQKYGDLDLNLPPSPPIFALADPAASSKRLEAAGFGSPAFRQLEIGMPITGNHVAFDFVINGGVRSRLIYEAQIPEKQKIIKDKLAEAIAEFAANGKTAIPCPAVLVTAQKLV